MLTLLPKSGPMSRRGAVLVLMTFLLPVVLVICFFSVDVAYMLLLRTQLRVATDAAARAAGTTLSVTGDEGSATAAAQQVALLNQVGGQGLALTASNVDFGQATQSSGSGRYHFANSGSQEQGLNAVRVTASATRPLFSGQLLGVSEFTPHQIATASYRLVDVCLVLDRSSSMKLYTTETDSGLSSSDPRTCQAPHAQSRWVALETAVNEFVNVLESNHGSPRVAVITYGSNYTTPCNPAVSLPNARIDAPLSDNLAATRNAMAGLSAAVWGGMTEIHSGMQLATSVLTDANAGRPTARKIMIVLTDGHYTGSDPVPYATTAASHGITVHSVTFGTGANQTAMQNLADAGGGEFYHAPDAATLNEVFRQLAAMPLMLTE